MALPSYTPGRESERDREREREREPLSCYIVMQKWVFEMSFGGRFDLVLFSYGGTYDSVCGLRK